MERREKCLWYRLWETGAARRVNDEGGVVWIEGFLWARIELEIRSQALQVWSIQLFESRHLSDDQIRNGKGIYEVGLSRVRLNTNNFRA
jgi:hypothetical protein